MTDLQRTVEQWVRRQVTAAQQPPVLMISGAQGIGKSTALESISSHHKFRVAVIGLDDAYHSRETRQALARDVHPLCETRGPPGTHDLALLEETIDCLLTASTTSITPIPKFDKRSDDRVPRAEWQSYLGRPDAVVVEGWLLGVTPDPISANEPPINRLETEHDADGVWRAWQEDHLQSDYAALWNRAAAFLHLDAPSFEVVLKWRIQQEETTLGLEPGTLPQERADWVADFVQHFERLTLRMLDGDRRDGMQLRVDERRRILSFPGV